MSLEKERRQYLPKLPPKLSSLFTLGFEPSGPSKPLSEDLKVYFSQERPPLKAKAIFRADTRALRVGVFFSGGQAPGGHNVVTGLFDALKKLHPQSELFGFCQGPDGLLHGKYRQLDALSIDDVRNMGGFDLLGSSRTKIKTDEQFEKAKKSVLELALDGLVVIGGDDSNTNAAFLAERLKPCRVIGIPKTIDGDMRGSGIEMSFGFDTACRVYSELIGNLARDALSANKYSCFIRLMGRSASHIALECALGTHPNICLIGEEIAVKRQSLSDITAHITDVIEKRSAKGLNHNIILIPEGLIEFIPQMQALIEELNRLLAKDQYEANDQRLLYQLTDASRSAFAALPSSIASQLLKDRDPHGNVQVSLIETEKLLIEMVANELKKRKSPVKFSPLAHFFGYEGRCSMPSNFDADFCYALGHCATALIAQGYSGYVANIANLAKSADEWEPCAVPISDLFSFFERHGARTAAIAKKLVHLDEEPFLTFAACRDLWALSNHYAFPGPLQFFGPPTVCDVRPMTLSLGHSVL